MNQLSLTIISAIFIGGITGYMGTLMLSRKMSMVAGPLAHLSLPGVALAILYGFSISLGVFPFVILGAVLIWFLREKTKLPMENLAAIIFASGVGVALLILPINQAEEALIGNIGKISLIETCSVIVLSTLLFLISKFIYKKIMLVNISEELAKTEKINISLYNLLYLLCIAFVVALGVYLVGGLITAALVAIPSASSKNINKSLDSYKIWAVIFGITSAVVGVFISSFVKLPIGPTIIIVNVVIFLITIFINKKNNL
jgi:ABC-type Mn2+/Zn2+ transport system permease subunit